MRNVTNTPLQRELVAFGTLRKHILRVILRFALQRQPQQRSRRRRRAVAGTHGSIGRSNRRGLRTLFRNFFAPNSVGLLAE